MIDPTTIDAIRGATDIVELIGSDLELKKKGADYKGVCPFHNEKSGSFNVNPERQIYHCFGCRASGDVYKWLKEYAGMSFIEAVEHLGKKAGIDTTPRAPRKLDRSKFDYSDPDPAPARSKPTPQKKSKSNKRRKLSDEFAGRPAFDWKACLDAFDDAAVARMIEERGFSEAFIRRMHAEGLVGLYQDCFAFPVHEGGEVVRCHYRTKTNWAYSGKGGSTPLIIGDVENAACVTAHESQWDAFAMLDVLCYHEDPRELAAIITRGSTAKTDLSEFPVPAILAIPQNDPEEKKNKKGLTPAEQWLELVQSGKDPKTRMLVGRVPEEFEDLNDWTRTKPDPSDVRGRLIDMSLNPALKGIKTAADLLKLASSGDDPDCMIGLKNRWLSRGGSGIFVGPSGIGKSTLISAITSHWAAGVPWQGIDVRKPLKILVIQAENDDRDTGEMLEAAFESLKKSGNLTKEQIEKAKLNLIFKNETERTGRDWAEWIEEMIVETGADLVIGDPLLSYIGDDISSQKVCSEFLRNWIQPVLKRTGAILLFVHHTGKTSADAKSRSHWSSSDYSYVGIGSSEITNWARTMINLMPANSDANIFKFAISKRGKRAGMTSAFSGGTVSHIYLAHSAEAGGLGWKEVQEPMDDEDEDDGYRPPKKRARKQKVRTPASDKANGIAPKAGTGQIGKAIARRIELEERAKKLPETRITEAELLHRLVHWEGLDSASAARDILSMKKLKIITEREGYFTKTKK